ncbi:MAG: hypothetical protein H0W20_14095 [Chthoniobacterales bacterium]|nr:hypothetical protein [Chthoniobacterales bacterium]
MEHCAGDPRAGEPELRARSSRFDLQLLEGVARTFGPAKEKRSFTVDVFEDLPLKVEAMHVEMYGPARFVIHGVVAAAESIPAGTVLLSVVNGVLQGKVRTADGRKFAIDHLDRLTKRFRARQRWRLTVSWRLRPRIRCSRTARSPRARGWCTPRELITPNLERSRSIWRA